MKKYILLITIISLFNTIVYAQKEMTEGNIQYNIYVNNNQTPEGTYIISVKGGNIKRMLSMNNGYNNVTVYNVKTGKTLSLNENNQQKYALEMNQEEVSEKNKKFSNASFKITNENKVISGYNCVSAIVTYSNNDNVQIYYTKELLPPSQNFNAMFPGLQGIALEYEVKNNNNTSMKFVANKIDLSPVDTKIFNIPADYKIVTKTELEQLK